MKKSKRIFFTLLAAVMLLGVVPAYAAAPLSPLAALLAIPVSGQLMNTGTVSDSISKALTVSKPSEPAPVPAPAPEPTPAPAASSSFSTTPASIADGTTGATVSTVGETTIGNLEMWGCGEIKALYNRNNERRLDTTIQWSKSKILYSPDKGYLSTLPVALTIDITKCTPADLVGITIPADLTVDVFFYDPNTHIYTFLCQYDTHGTGAFTITQVPSVLASKPKEAPAPARTSFNDVKSGDWYYEAVTALAQGGVIHTVFDTDPNGNFNPNALIESSEIDFVKRRLRGIETEGLVMDKVYDRLDVKTGDEPTDRWNAISSRTSRDRALYSILQYHNGLTTKPAAPAQLDTRQADREAIAKFAEYYASTKTNRTYWSESVEKCRAIVQEYYGRADALNLIRTPGTPDVIDFDARLTRAEYCVLLYRAGLTSFGCAPHPTDLQK